MLFAENVYLYKTELFAAKAPAERQKLFSTQPAFPLCLREGLSRASQVRMNMRKHQIQEQIRRSLHRPHSFCHNAMPVLPLGKTLRVQHLRENSKVRKLHRSAKLPTSPPLGGLVSNCICSARKSLAKIIHRFCSIGNTKSALSNILKL